MKNFIIIIATLAAFNYACAQTDANSYAANTNPEKKNSFVTYTNSYGPVKKINSKTLKHFAKDYRNASQAVWYYLPKNETMCRFYENGILNRAYYSAQGNFIVSEKAYEEADMPKDVRSIIKSAYFDYNISYVQEIYVPGEEKVYVINIENNTSIKVLRIQDGDMSVMQEFEKS